MTVGQVGADIRAVVDKALDLRFIVGAAPARGEEGQAGGEEDSGEKTHYVEEGSLRNGNWKRGNKRAGTGLFGVLCVWLRKATQEVNAEKGVFGKEEKILWRFSWSLAVCLFFPGSQETLELVGHGTPCVPRSGFQFGSLVRGGQVGRYLVGSGSLTITQFRLRTLNCFIQSMELFQRNSLQLQGSKT